MNSNIAEHVLFSKVYQVYSRQEYKNDICVVGRFIDVRPMLSSMVYMEYIRQEIINNEK